MRHRPAAFRSASLAVLIAPLLTASIAFAEPSPFVRPAPTPDARALPTRFGTSAAPMPRPYSTASADDGSWREFGLLQVSGPLSVFDAAHDELLSIGGSRPTNWILPLSDPTQWHPLPEPGAPIDLDTGAATFDPEHGVVYAASQVSSGLEIRTLDPRTGAVATIVASGTPPLVQLPALLFDPVSQRLIVFGGFDPTLEPYPQATNRVWALTLSVAPAWSELAPTGTPPPPMVGARLVLDPVRRQLLIPDARQVGSGSVWALALDGPPQWTPFGSNGFLLDTNSNPFVHDPASDRFWTVDNEAHVFALTPGTWQWQNESPAVPGPSPRSSVGLAVDLVRNRLLVSGGFEPTIVPRLGVFPDDTHADTWAYSLTEPHTWTRLTPDPIRPPVRAAASDALDSGRHRLVVFGGADQVGGFRNDTWALDLGVEPTWSAVGTDGPLPPPRYWHASAWDETRDQMLVYGGTSGNFSAPLGDLWALSFAGARPTWTPLAPAGPTPPPRMTPNLVFDSRRDRFLLMFGDDGHQGLADVWELRLAPSPTWRALTPAGTPPAARAAAMAAYDPVHDRVIVFGGATIMDDLWALDLGQGVDGTWAPLTTTSRPAGRGLGLFRLDTLRDRMVLFGGFGLVQEPDGPVIEWQDDAWGLDLSGTPEWRQLSPVGPLPPARDRMNGAYDEPHDRLVLACGSVGSSPTNDTWALAFGDVPTPTLLSLARRVVTATRVHLEWSGAEPGERVTAYRRARLGDWVALGEMFADGRGFVTLDDRDVSPGARLEYRLGVSGPLGETFFGTTTVDVPFRALSVAARTADGRFTLTVDLPTGEPASLAIYDLAGRRVWSRSVGELGAGTHELSTDGPALPSALYFVRLTQGHGVSGARVAMTR